MSEVTQSCLTLHLHRLQPARLLFPWDFPGKNTGVDWHFLLQGIFLTGIEPRSSAMQADSSPGKATININYEFFLFIFACFVQLPIHCWVQLSNWAHTQFSVQSFSHVWFFATPWTTALQASLSITNSQNPPKPMFIVSVMPSNHLILCRLLLLLPPIHPSIRVFSDESTLHIRWPKYWSFSFSISPSNEHPELISFRMDWLDLLAVQGTLKSLL